MERFVRRVNPKRMVLVAVTTRDEKFIFDHSLSEGSLWNVGFSPEQAGRKFIREVTGSRKAKFMVNRSPALGRPVYFIFWFPEVNEFAVDDWKGKVNSIDDEKAINPRRRQVIETALAQARIDLTHQNWRETA